MQDKGELTNGRQPDDCASHRPSPILAARQGGKYVALRCATLKTGRIYEVALDIKKDGDS